MLSRHERQDIAASAVEMAAHLTNNQLPPLVRDTIDRHIYAYLLNVELAAVHAQGPAHFPNIIPGFGLLVMKPKDLVPGTQELPEAIPSDALEVTESIIAQILEAILPASTETLYHHYETVDGLICAVYRMTDELQIFAAAGIDHSAVNEMPLVVPTVH
jgi:hypothetical protein